MNAMTLFRSLSGVGMIPTHILIRGDTLACAVTSVREAGDDVAIALEDGRDVLISEREAYAGVFIAPRVVRMRARAAGGKAIQVLLLGIPDRPFSARARRSMATMQ